MNKRRAVLLGVAAVLILAFAFRGAILRIAVGFVAGAAGYPVTYRDLRIGRDGIAVDDLTVHYGLVPLLEVRRAEVGVHWPGFVAGASAQFGFTGVRLERPRLTLVRNADGSWNVPLHRGAAEPKAPSRALAPLAFTASIRDGELIVDDALHGPLHPVARLTKVDGDATIDTAAQSTYAVSASIQGGSALYVRGFARARNGVSRTHVQAADVPIARLLSVFVDPASVRFSQGRVRDLDAFLYSHKGGDPHLVGSARVNDLRLSLAGLLQPLAVSGDVVLVDGGLATRAMHASIAGIPLRAAGLIYGIPDLPSISIGAQGTGTLEQARTLFAFSKHLPLAGDARLNLLVHGVLADPVVLVASSSERASYDRRAVDRVQARVGYNHDSVSVLAASAAYATIAIGAQAGLDIGPANAPAAFALTARGDSALVPYLGHLTGSGTVRADAVANGPADALTGSASVDARGRHGAITAAPVRFTLAGAVSAPVFATQPGGGSFAGLVHREPSGRLAIWGDARRFRLEPSRAIELGDAGSISGGLDATVGVFGLPSQLQLVGRASVHDAQIGPLALTTGAVQFGGTPAGTRLHPVEGRGPFGAFAGIGEFAGSRLALDGRYDGSFEQLRALTGELGAKGPVHGQVRIALQPGSVTVQTAGTDVAGSTVHGVPLTTVAGTVALAGGGVAVAQAVGRVAGGDVVAWGPQKHLSFVATRLDARTLRSAGIPLDAGAISAGGTAGVGPASTDFTGSVVLNNGSYHHIRVAGTSAVELREGSHVRFDAEAIVGGSVAHAAGRAGLRGASSTYDLDLTTLGLSSAALRAGGIALPAQLNAPLDLEGHLSGAGRTLSAHGRIDVPVGSYGALPFTAAHADVEVDPARAQARNGRVSVGSTTARFAAAADLQGTDLSARLDARHIDLGDFDLYFARADTLAGSGAIRASLDRRNGALSTTGAFVIADATVVRPAGDIAFEWAMRDSRTIAGNASITSSGNGLKAIFRVTPAESAPLLSPFAGAFVSATLRARNDNLLRDATLVIPPGFPTVSGRLAASGVVQGRVPDLVLAGTGTMRAGAIGQVPYEQISLSLRADRRGATITDARVNAIGSTANGSGYVRFGAVPSVDLRAAVEVPQVHDVVSTLTNRPVALFGRLEASAKMTGSFAHPFIEGAAFMPGGTFNGVTIARAVGSFGVSGSDVELRDATITFPNGGVQLAGTLPVRINPFRIGPRNAPIGFDLSARDLDLADFTPLLPAGSQLAGKLAGRVGVNGTVRNPQLYGSLALTNGKAYSPEYLSDPITAIEGAMTFAGHGLTLDHLSAKAGPGTLNAAASAAFESGEVATRVQFRAEKALIGIPSIVRGTFDADVGFEKLPAQIAALSGTIELNDATIPFSALYASKPGGGTAPLPALALDLKATAGRNVRVRSANVDIGGAGTILVGGTLAQPRLDGTLASTGGTVTFGNRSFRLQEGSVAFSPDAGFNPDIAATATTRVPNSDPNTARNPTGSATVDLAVTGTLNNPTTVLTSQPSYSQDQILGLLLGIPALGASLFSDSTPGVPGSHQPVGGGNFVGQEALGLVNAQFTRLLLSPFESQVSSALGLSSFDINIGGVNAFGVSARKLLGRNIYAIYTSSFVYPYRQTFGFELRARRYTAAQLLYYQTLATSVAGSCSLVSPFVNAGAAVAVAQQSCSQQGFNLSIKQYFPPP